MIKYLTQKKKKKLSIWYLILLIIILFFLFSQYQTLQKSIIDNKTDHIISDYKIFLKSKNTENLLIENIYYIDNSEFIDEFASSTPILIDKNKINNKQYTTLFHYYNKNDSLPTKLHEKKLQLGTDEYIYNINKNTIELFGIVKDTGYVLITKEINDTINIKESIDNFFIHITIFGFVNLLIFVYLLSLFNENDNQKLQLYEEQRNLNTTLKAKIEEKTKEFKQQQEVIQKQELNILAQSKNAQMGEMIGNIAHQWRQPLSVISTIASGMQLKKEMNMLSDDYFHTGINRIMQSTLYLSQTIDTFMNFIKENKIFTEIILSEHINQTIKIVEATLHYNNILLLNEIEQDLNTRVKTIPSELSEVFINLINNAKDILVERSVKEPWIKLSIEESNQFLTIYIEDNAGGIPDHILPKVFDPYFTTKHQSQGTGLGLYMSKKIITESLNGKLNVNNSQYGARFYIELPL